MHQLYYVACDVITNVKLNCWMKWRCWRFHITARFTICFRDCSSKIVQWVVINLSILITHLYVGYRDNAITSNLERDFIFIEFVIRPCTDPLITNFAPKSFKQFRKENDIELWGAGDLQSWYYENNVSIIHILKEVTKSNAEDKLYKITWRNAESHDRAIRHERYIDPPF